MAAPCAKMCSRSLGQFLISVGQTAVGKTWMRRFSVSFLKHASLQSKRAPKCVASQWKLMGAACLQRLPVISQEPSPTEKQFAELMHQMELERSLLSDHELRLLEDAEMMRRRQAEDYDSDEEEAVGGQEIVLTQDLEDSWEQRLKLFQPTPRFQAGSEESVESPERWLAEPLVLLTQQQVGSDRLWLLPQTLWQEGESLKQTAQRALTSLPVAGLQATFLGGAPCGVYKYKLPQAARTEGIVGVKVFFFKAVLGGGPLPPTSSSSVWVRKSELKDFLKPAYLEKVKRFLIDL